ncbi:hypothetical protein RHOFW510R12_01550 [Rhodanobacter sp. FW510-R12]|uniref:hypothetical protein n=1 Tax=unclassified Rhodanobacter TaxID=2621553 RepID=UPI0007AA261C|nr:MULTISPECIES: hypothetical protein [unclassified Rhodanobacter]KZC17010.1 hypothetical protein RHOFW104R8_13290 [Rhodanobacter sp. FW104-R8]KZC28534.1 hypothetical protein RhoFW510T8_10530 [Rhodanobacter sp. FW510-T8]KZC32363.1 hypothetical protein RhoFW510R10_13095 [Rhodanobacter sp. FW510-R10]
MPNLASLPAADLQAGADNWNRGFKNYLINGDFAINQRVFAGGALAAGVYGFDRWKAGTGGCNISLSAGVLTHTSGPLVQVIEAPDLAGKTITVSVDALTGGNLTVNVEGVIGTIVAGSGRVGVAVAVPAGSTGNVTLTLTPAGAAVTYKRVQIELGSVATEFEWRPSQIELSLCQRYGEAVNGPQILGFAFSATDMMAGYNFAMTKRSAPTITNKAFGTIIGNGVAVGIATAIAFTAATPTVNGFTADITPPSNLVQGYGYVYRGFSIFADAEL